MEIAELPPALHPYFLATQYHPELTSRPLRPAPVFLGLMQVGSHIAYLSIYLSKLPSHVYNAGHKGEGAAAGIRHK